METKVRGNLIDVHLERTYPVEIAVQGERIQNIRMLDTEQENFIVPGFVDAHVHIESSLLVPENFSRVAVDHGTVATVSDPHEIANVCGLEGVQYMVDNGRRADVKFFWSAPSCVPATQFETSGAVLDVKEVGEMLQWEGVVALGEMMNYPGVIYGDATVLDKCSIARKFNKVIDGHAPGLKGEDLLKYISAGISTDHECAGIEEALEKLQLGMKILIREGSSAKNFDALQSLIGSHPDQVMLCSDDLHADDLLKGHLNLLIKRALKNGTSIYNILKTVSVNPVNHYQLPVGLVRVGDPADFVVIDNPADFNVLETWINGKNVKVNEAVKPDSLKTINKFNATRVRLEDLAVVPAGDKVRVIGVDEGSIITSSLEYSFNGSFESFMKQNEILGVYVKNRYNDGIISKALVQGFGDMKGALATSIAHDSHNIIALGGLQEDVVCAMNLLIGEKGGIVYYSSENGIVEVLPLPVGGLMSLQDVPEVSSKYERIISAVKSSGCSLNSPMMTLAFLSLLVIPALKLSDRGLFDVEKFGFTDLFFE